MGGLSGRYIAYHAKERARAAVIMGDTALPSLEIMAERDIVAVLVDLDMSQLLVISIYLEPQGAVDGQIRTLNGLLNRFREVSIVIQGDFNVKHSIWGNTVEKSDARGDEILEFAIRNDLTIFNVPDCDPTFSSARGESWIDLTMGRLQNPCSAIEWEVVDDLTGTEHRRLSFVVSTSSPDPIPSNRIRVKDLNMLKFREVLSERLGGMGHEAWLEGRSGEECVSEMTSIIQEACKASIKGRTSRKRVVPWWNTSLTIARKRAQAARRRFKKCKEDPALRMEYEIAYRKHHSKFK